MDSKKRLVAWALVLALMPVIGCGSGESQLPTAVTADEEKQLEESQQKAALAERQQHASAQ